MQIKYECVPGFSLVGKDTRYCQKDGTWTPSELPTCVPVQCGLPESPVNGKAHYTALVRPKPLFWFRFDTETETQIGRYCNRYRNHISKEESSKTDSMGYFSIIKGLLKPNLLPNTKDF